MAIVSTKPIGDFPGIPAPDESWRLRNDWPVPGERVELCWASRKESPARYAYGEGWLVGHDADGRSEWKNRHGDTLIFGPDFWRPPLIPTAGDKALATLREINSRPESNSSRPHIDADEALKQFFVDIRRQDIADEYEKVQPKWYE